MNPLFQSNNPRVDGVLHFDGSADPNPGPNCRCGFILRMGAKVIEKSIFIGDGTNNTAEYRGLIEGMTAALAAGVSHIEVYGDSQLVIRGVKSGRPNKKGKPHLEKLKAEAIALAKQFEVCDLNWICREQNSEADVLSTQHRSSCWD